MRLVAFSVRNYRSIIEAYKLSLGSYTVLVGPNNEGKSNVLKAIALSLTILGRARPSRLMRGAPTRYSGAAFRYDYDWARDFPVSLQARYPNGRSEFTAEFELAHDDFRNFREKVGVNLTTNLKLKITCGPSDASLDVLMKGPGKQTLNSRREQISEFIRTHVSSQYISAMRPSTMALEIVHRLIEGELSNLESNEAYQDLLTQLQAIRQPVLDKIANELGSTVSDFVPGIRGVRITGEMASALRSNFSILVDDGTETDLAAKGDGIISLATMSLVKYASEQSVRDESLILSIEEPESHLHPGAIHGLRKVLKDISSKHQVVISTHSPILVERDHISRNILVRDGHAVRARKIGDIRDALGIMIADNLVGANVILLVEGEEDRDLLSTWLGLLSPQLKSALSRGTLVIDHLGGASNLNYKVSFYKNLVVKIHAFLDNDDDGRRAVEGAVDRNVLDQADYTLASCRGMRNSEMEDLLELSTYASVVDREFGVNLAQGAFRHARSKWSDRLGELFQSSGKLWSKSVKMQVKRVVVDACISQGASSLNVHRRSVIDALISSLEAKLEAR